MREILIDSHSSGVSSAPEAAAIKGHLGTLDVALATLAYCGPLTSTAGYITFVIGSGNGIGAPGAFIAVMIAFIFFSVGYGAMSKYIPNPGAFYAYITAGLGRSIGLGSSFLVLASYLSIGVGFYAFAGLAFKQLVEGWGGNIYDWWYYSIIFWVCVATVSYFNVALSAKLLGLILISEVLIAIVFDVVVLSNGGPEGVSFKPFTWDAFSSGHLGIAFIFGAALFAGFESTAIYREETKNPGVTIPRATILVVLFIGLFFALTSWALITGLGVSKAVDLSNSNPSGAFFDVAKFFLGDTYYKLVSILLLTSVFAAHLSIQNVTTRYIYSLAVDGVFPKALGVAHEKHKSPSRASLLSSGLYLTLTGALVVLGFTADQIYAWFAGLASFSILCAMAITSLAAFWYFRTHRALGVTVWEGTIAPLLSVICLSAMVYLGYDNFAFLINGSQELANLMLSGALIIFCLGVFVALWLRKSRPAIYARIGRQ